ncbi:uncharacterized protein LOC135369475 [Ornithodoros turicata]|uniref:uncharacterized protein LOC135369475 n=1 Tax=Ornithodoros turicata TaxID=34597 RepID=UPI003138ADB9
MTSNQGDKGFLIRLVPTSNPQLQQPSQPQRPAATENNMRPVICPGIHISQTTFRTTLQQQPRLSQETYLQAQQLLPPPFQPRVQQAYQHTMQQQFQQPFQQPVSQFFHMPFEQGFPRPVYSPPISPYVCQPMQQQFVPQFAPQRIPHGMAHTMAQVTQLVPPHMEPTVPCVPIYRQVPVSSTVPVSLQGFPSGLSVTAIANAGRECKSNKEPTTRHSCCCLGQHSHDKSTAQAANSPMASTPYVSLPNSLFENLVARVISPPPPQPAGNITLGATVSMGKKNRGSSSSLLTEAEKTRSRPPKAKRKKKHRTKTPPPSSSSSSSEHKKKDKPPPPPPPGKKGLNENVPSPPPPVPPSPGPEPEVPIPPEPPTPVTPVLPPQVSPEAPTPPPPVSPPPVISPPRSPRAASLQPPFVGEEEHDHVIYHEEQPPVMHPVPLPNTVSPGGSEALNRKEPEDSSTACVIVVVVVVICLGFCMLCVIFPSIIDTIFGLRPSKGTVRGGRDVRFDISDAIDGLKRVRDAILKFLPPTTESDGTNVEGDYTRFF